MLEHDLSCLLMITILMFIFCGRSLYRDALVDRETIFLGYARSKMTHGDLVDRIKPYLKVWWHEASIGEGRDDEEKDKSMPQWRGL